MIATSEAISMTKDQLAGFMAGLFLISYGAYLGIGMLKRSTGQKLSYLFSAYSLSLVIVGFYLLGLNSPAAEWPRLGLAVVCVSFVPLAVGFFWLCRILEADMNNYATNSKLPVTKVVYSTATFSAGIGGMFLAFLVK